METLAGEQSFNHEEHKEAQSFYGFPLCFFVPFVVMFF